MRFLLTFILLIMVLSVTAQYSDYSKRTPNEHGVTHHFIKENKIQLLKNQINSKALLIKYQRRVKIGYAEIALGTGLLTYSGCFMDVPQWYEGGYNKHKAQRDETARYIVAGIGVGLITLGSITIHKNNKLLKRIEFILSPRTGGFKFYI